MACLAQLTADPDASFARYSVARPSGSTQIRGCFAKVRTTAHWRWRSLWHENGGTDLGRVLLPAIEQICSFFAGAGGAQKLISSYGSLTAHSFLWVTASVYCHDVLAPGRLPHHFWRFHELEKGFSWQRFHFWLGWIFSSRSPDILQILSQPWEPADACFR